MILEAEGVTKAFGGLVAVSNVSVRLERGVILGLIGPNGAGKTTLLNVVAGYYRPDAGTIRLKGESIAGLSPETICRKGLARTFQICQPFPEMTAMENVLVAAVFGNPMATDPYARAREALRFVDFPLPGDVQAGSLNTAQLKRLDIARALASEPEVVLLDEAGAGLTPTELLKLTELVRKMRDAGIAIILVEHLMRLVMNVCDTIVVLHHGEKIAEGTPDEVAGDERVIDAYLGEAYLLK